MTRTRTLSLRARLTLAVACVLVASLSAFSLVLDAAFRRALLGQFDARLREDAVAVASMIEQFPDGRWEFEAGPLPGFEAGGGAFFEARTRGGLVVARSGSLAGRTLPVDAASGDAQTGEVTLPDGRRGRFFRAVLPARPGDERSITPVDSVVVTVEHGTEEVDAAMARLRLLLWVSGLTAMGLATVAGTLAVRQGLVPLGQLNSQLDAMDVQLLHERVPLEGLPGELRPTVVKINELLGRLAESFERERRFGADASHELRTPLAAIRSILDVALSRERSVAEHRAAAQAALAVSRQMSTLVDGLLALARLDASQEPAQPERVALPELLDECCAGLAPRAAARGLRLETSVAPDAALFLDRERLRTIVVNLLTNAVEYTAEGGAILVTSDPAYGTVLEVRDSGPPIPADAVERVFDRFFRLDSARTAVGEHWGIGLALVRALCNTLGLSVVAENTPDGWVAFRITFAAGVSQGHEQTARQERILAGPLPSAPVRS